MKELKELLPTPAKSHYTFNLRDVSTVFQGFCQGTCESRPKGDDLAKVWYHECERVFWDRLATKQGHGWLFSKLKSNMNRHFKKEFDQLCKGADAAILTDFVDAKPTAYLEVVDHVRLGEKVSGCLENYNPVGKIRMDLVLSQTEISKGYGMDCVTQRSIRRWRSKTPGWCRECDGFSFNGRVVPSCCHALRITSASCGPRPKEYTPYSLRRGGATCQFQLAGSFAKVAERGRWSSERAVGIYVNKALADMATDSGTTAWASNVTLTKLLHRLPTEG